MNNGQDEKNDDGLCTESGRFNYSAVDILRPALTAPEHATQRAPEFFRVFFFSDVRRRFVAQDYALNHYHEKIRS